MKDDLAQLLKDRFVGHESPVDPGLWNAIQSQLGSEQLASSEEGMKELLQDKFNGHEVPVDPTVWSNISQQLGHGAAAGGVGSGLFAWVAAAIGVVVIAGGTLFYLNTKDAPRADLPATEIPAPAPDPVAPTVAVKPSAQPLTIVPKEQVEERPTARPSAPAKVAERAVRPVAPEQAQREHAPEITSEPAGARIVEDILAELTTRVTEEVMAEAAERSADTNTPPTQVSEPEVTELDHAQERELPKLFLPNTFTPNDDGVNDTYTVLDADQFQRVMMRVYDVRSDRLVFSTNTNEPWTGDGCMDGYYLVAVEAVTSEGELVTKGKVVWLNRNTMH